MNNKGGIVRSGSEIPFFDGYSIKSNSAIKLFDGYKIKNGQAVKMYQSYNCYAQNNSTLITGGINADGSCDFTKPVETYTPSRNIEVIHFIFPSPITFIQNIEFAKITNPSFYGGYDYAIWLDSSATNELAYYSPKSAGETISFISRKSGTATDFWFGLENALALQEYKLTFGSGNLTIDGEQITDVILI